MRPFSALANCCALIKGEADHIDHNIRLEFLNLPAKGAVSFGGAAVDYHLLHLVPGAMGLVGLPLSPGHRDHLVAGFHQTRNEVCANVAAGADHHNACHVYHLSVICAYEGRN